MFYACFKAVLMDRCSNEETATAMIEADAIAHDSEIKGYENLSDLMTALDL